MRKRAKKGPGQSDHVYQSPSPLEVATQPALPLCKFCKQREAVFLDEDHQKERVNVFCCTSCAVAFALHQHVLAGVQWCQKHRCWTLSRGHCQQCHAEDIKRLNDQNDYLRRMSSGDKEVSNG